VPKAPIVEADQPVTETSAQSALVAAGPPGAVAALPAVTVVNAAQPPLVEAGPPVAAAALPAETVVNAPQPALVDFATDNTSSLSWPSNPESVAWFAADGYHLAARRPGQFVALGILSGRDLRDVLMTATFRKTGGPAGGGYGIIVRDQDAGSRDGFNQRGSYIVFEVGDKGEIGIWRRDQDLWVEIMGWTPSSAAHPAAGDNVLTVRALGSQLTFTVNGSEVATPTDSQLAPGSVGVFLGGDANEAVLTRLTVTPLD